MRDFRTLKVWEKAHELALGVYRATKEFPREEQFGLISQMRRAGASIPTNIAEGCGRASGRDIAHFYQIALGSASELEYQLLLARDLGFLPAADHGRLTEGVTEVKRMLAALVSRVRAAADQPRPKLTTDY